MFPHSKRLSKHGYCRVRECESEKWKGTSRWNTIESLTEWSLDKREKLYSRKRNSESSTMPSSDSQTQPSPSRKRSADDKIEEFMPVDLKAPIGAKDTPQERHYRIRWTAQRQNLRSKEELYERQPIMSTRTYTRNLPWNGTRYKTLVKDTKKPLANWKGFTFKTSGEIISKMPREFHNLAGLTWNKHTQQRRRQSQY